MKIITIKFDNASEWQFMLELLKSLNFRFEWKEVPNIQKEKDKNGEDLVSKLFGSFPSDLSSDELVQSIYEARINQTREINL